MDRGNGVGVTSPGMSRAERFEDEKRRLIESCFNRKDPDGSLQETYITHIKITEFSTHPSAPPPPTARTPDSEKPRVIVIAVRKSGIVRMHKTKENANGTFSIGKTWNLGDLTHIQSFTALSIDPNLRECAGDTGFLVTIQKSYFWQAQTDKEKKFFIASLIKIFGKYTGGRVPELSGFDQRELDQVLGTGKKPPPARMPMPDGASQVGMSTPSPALNGPSIPPQASPSPRNLYHQNGGSSPAGSFDSTRSQNQAALRRLVGDDKSQDSAANSFTTARSDDAGSLPPRSRGGITGPPTIWQVWRPVPRPIR